MKAKLIILCLVPTILLAQDSAPDPTAQALEASRVLVRLHSAKRIDAIGKELLPLIKGLLPEEIAGIIEKGSASSLLIAELGLGGKEIALGKPIYISPLPHGPYTIATGREGLLTAGPPGTTDAAKRGKPTAMLAGDVSVHIYADKLIAEMKPMIEQGMNMANGMMGMIPVPLPEPVKKLVPAAMDIGRDVIYGIESIDYALTHKGAIFLSEGRITSKEGSNFRKMLAAAGAAQDNILVGYLPKGALVYSDAAGGDLMAKTMTTVFEAKLGEGAGLAYGHMMGADIGSWGVTTGRSASCISMQGMMARTALSIHELKEDVDPATVVDKFDTEKVNAALKKHGIGIQYSVKKDVAAHGDTKMHQIVIDAQDPILGMVTGSSETYVAAVGRHLLVVQSLDPATDMKALIDRARGEPDMEHPHIKAMSRFGRKRHAGITFNVSGLKPMGMMMGMFFPPAAQIFNGIPENLTVSTAITIADGNIHWRGDWPVKEMASFAGALMGGGAAGADEPDPEVKDEDFDDDD